MRVERWWWLGWFCFLSICIHLVIGRVSPSLSIGQHRSSSNEIEIALEPLPEPKEPKPEKKPEPKPKKKPEARPGAIKQPRPEPPKPTRLAKAAPMGPKDAPKPLVKAEEPRPVAPKVNLGGEDPTKVLKPLPLGLATGQKKLAPQPIRTARMDPSLKPDPQDATPAPSPRPETLADKLTLKTPGLAPRIGLDRSALAVDNPLTGAAARTEEKPGFGGPDRSAPNAGGPRLSRTALATPSNAGGGSPAPGPNPGKNGLKGPEAPIEDVLYNGGGAGGANLPKAAPRIGGGGGRTVLSVNNPLASDAIPEAKPGLGPGTGGGGGTGAGGGVGFARGKGIGTSPDGRLALATQRSKPGSGIGAGEGDGIGTRSPGGGKGTGAELPGTGGTGTGYGKGSGVGIGNGRGVGFAAGAPGGGGRGGGAGAGGGGAGGGRMVLNRGIPFGDLSGLLTGGNERGGGGKGGGPGGPGKGSLQGQRPGLGGNGGNAYAPASIVYVMDTSGSMNQGNKIGKAKEALKKALSELKPGDSFNIVTFDANVRWFAASLLDASPANVSLGLQYVEAIQLRGGTNLSAGLEKAFSDARATHVFLLSDGEPSRGITDVLQLRLAVKQWNRQQAQLLTLALGLGEDFPGIPLLKGLAEDNEGRFSYVNLAK